jgi:hypothetical protein
VFSSALKTSIDHPPSRLASPQDHHNAGTLEECHRIDAASLPLGLTQSSRGMWRAILPADPIGCAAGAVFIMVMRGLPRFRCVVGDFGYSQAW